jgi:hypothetical protein
MLRLAVLALGFALGPFAALAHPLPSSTLTLTPEAGKLELTLTIPAPELIAAWATAADLGDLPPNSTLTAPQQNDLAAYLRQHMTLTPADHAALDLQLISAKLQDAKNEDVDHYDLLVIEMAATLPKDQNLFPATLTYDAVLHEVRNHRATVWLAQSGKAALPLGEIRFEAGLGRANPLVLSGSP